MTLNNSDTEFINSHTVKFKNMTVGSLPITISGIYDSSKNTYTSLSHELLNSKDGNLNKYLNDLGLAYITNYLLEKGFNVEGVKINAKFPFDEIKVNEYKIGGQDYSFELDILSGGLKNITRNSTGERADRMAFDDFLNIETSSNGEE